MHRLTARRCLLATGHLPRRVRFFATSAQSKPQEKQEWDETKDVIVVGSGGAGLLCGIMAGDNKLSSVILEKELQWGGTTAYSGGGVWIPCNFFMKNDSFERARTYMDATIGTPTPASSVARRDTFVREANEMMKYLRSKGFGWLHTTSYPDYYPEKEGGGRGRSVEGVAFDANKIGEDYKTLSSSILKKTEIEKYLLGTMPTEAITYVPTMQVSWKSLVEMMKHFSSSLYWLAMGRKPVSMGRSLIIQLRYILNKFSPDLRLNSALEDIIVSTDASGKKRVEGVVYMDRATGTLRRIKATKAVFFTAGGFAKNKEFREKHQPGLDIGWSMVNPGDTGEAIQIGMKHGAATELMEYGWWSITTPLPGTGLPRNAFVMYERGLPGCIMVGPSGKRFANEAENYAAIGQKMVDGKHYPAWMVVDATNRKRYPMGAMGGGQKFPKEYYDEKIVVKADTLEELAEKCQIDKNGLIETVKKWNEYCKNGKDLEWGRGDSIYDQYFGDRSQKNPNMGPIEKAPFYAMRANVGDLGTKGGLLTDEHARVLVKKQDGSYEPIEGLYGAGNVTASVMGTTYPGAGATLGPALTFAYVGMNHILKK